MLLDKEDLQLVSETVYQAVILGDETAKALIKECQIAANEGSEKAKRMMMAVDMYRAEYQTTIARLAANLEQTESTVFSTPSWEEP